MKRERLDSAVGEIYAVPVMGFDGVDADFQRRIAGRKCNRAGETSNAIVSLPLFLLALRNSPSLILLFLREKAVPPPWLA